MSITKLDIESKNLYMAGDIGRQISKQNSRRADTTIVRIPDSNIAVLYLETGCKIDSQEALGEFINSANGKNLSTKIKRYHLVGWGNILGADTKNMVLELTATTRLTFTALNNSSGNQSSSNAGRLYTANTITSLVNKQRQQSAVTFTYQPKATNFAVVVVQFGDSTESGDIEAYFRNSNTAHSNPIKAVGIIGVLDAADKTFLDDIMDEYQVSVSASAQLRASEPKQLETAWKPSNAKLIQF